MTHDLPRNDGPRVKVHVSVVKLVSKQRSRSRSFSERRIDAIGGMVATLE